MENEDFFRLTLHETGVLLLQYKLAQDNLDNLREQPSSVSVVETE